MAQIYTVTLTNDCNLTTFNWSLTKNGNNYSSGTGINVLGSSTIDFGSELGPGLYALTVSGIGCTGSDLQAFSVLPGPTPTPVPIITPLPTPVPVAPTPTPVPVFNCTCRTYAVGAVLNGWTGSYTNCFGATQTTAGGAGQFNAICACQNTFVSTSGGASASDQGGCSPAPVPTPTPTVTPLPIPVPVPVPVNQQLKEFVFVVNLTGNAFDFGSPGNNYISNNQIQLATAALTGSDADSVDAIRMPVIWGDYNPSPGVYRDAEMTVAINWIKSLRPSRPPKIDLLVVPILGFNDSRIPNNELSKDNNGNLQDCTYNFNTVPSYYSPTATNLLATMFDHLIPRLVSAHSNDIRMIEFGAGQSEEHYMPYTANYAGCGCGSCFGGIGDYSESSRNAWRTFLVGKYGLGILPYNINGIAYTSTTAELPNVGVTAGSNYNMNYSQSAYRDLFRFYSTGIFGTWKRFHDKVKQHSNFKTGYVIPDMLNDQGTRWIFHGGTIFEAMKHADQFYHTYNLHPGDWQANLWGTDTLLGTFPGQGKMSAIEYDNLDTGSNGAGPLNVTHVKESILRFVKNGGIVVHTALGWENFQVDQWKALIKDVKDNYINNPGWVLENRALAPTVTVDTGQIFYNSGIYTQAWTSVGGNHTQSPSTAAYNATPVNIYIQNNGTIDNFYLGT